MHFPIVGNQEGNSRFSARNDKHYYCDSYSGRKVWSSEPYIVPSKTIPTPDQNRGKMYARFQSKTAQKNLLFIKDMYM